MDARQPLPTYGLPSRSIALLIWGLILIQVALNARFIIPPMSQAASGAADFSIFYTGARILRFGLMHELYNLNVQAQFQTIFYRNRPLPYNHPAYELLVFLPLARSRFFVQYYSWLAINFSILIWIAIVLSKSFGNPLLRRSVFVLSAALAFPPIAVCLLQGQDTLLLTLIYSLTYSALKHRRDFLAGVLLSLGLFKFHLVIPFLLPMLIRRYWKFIQGFVSGAAVVIVISILITGFNGFLQYVALLRLLMQRPEIGYITPVLMPNLRGLLTLVFRSKPAIDLTLAVTSATVLAIAAWAMVPPPIRDRRFDGAFALNVASVALVSYHLYLHDLSFALLAILIGANALRGKKPEALFWCTAAALFCMPIYALALDNMVCGFVAIAVIALAISLILIRPAGAAPVSSVSEA